LSVRIHLFVTAKAEEENRRSERDQHNDDAQTNSDSGEYPRTAFGAPANNHVHRDRHEQFQDASGEKALKHAGVEGEGINRAPQPAKEHGPNYPRDTGAQQENPTGSVTRDIQNCL
jgi:hypothetical protein